MTSSPSRTAAPARRAARSRAAAARGGLDLGVLRVVDAACEAGRQVRFAVAESGAGTSCAATPAFRWPSAKVRSAARAVSSDAMTRPPAGLVLDAGLREGCGEFAPEPGGKEREVELGSGLVGDEEVAFAGPGGAAGDGPRSTTADGEAGAGRVVGAGRPDDSGADDHGVEGGRRCLVGTAVIFHMALCAHKTRPRGSAAPVTSSAGPRRCTRRFPRSGRPRRPPGRRSSSCPPGWVRRPPRGRAGSSRPSRTCP